MNQQVAELKGADVAVIVTMRKARVAALVDAAKAGRLRSCAERIVPGIDRGAAKFKGDGLGRSAITFETAGVQQRVFIEDVAALIGDPCPCGLTNQRI